MKTIHPDRIILVKVGTFYRTFGKDAYIISYLFNYEIIKTNNIVNCGFPKSATNKVLKKLEDENISYIVANRENNYEILEEMNFKKKNEYINYFNTAHKYIQNKKRIDKIYKFLLKNIDNDNIKEKIYKVEKIIYEV